MKTQKWFQIPLVSLQDEEIHLALTFNDRNDASGTNNLSVPYIHVHTVFHSRPLSNVRGEFLITSQIDPAQGIWAENLPVLSTALIMVTAYNLGEAAISKQWEMH